MPIINPVYRPTQQPLLGRIGNAMEGAGQAAQGFGSGMMNLNLLQNQLDQIQQEKDLQNAIKDAFSQSVDTFKLKDPSLSFADNASSMFPKPSLMPQEATTPQPSGMGSLLAPPPSLAGQNPMAGSPGDTGIPPPPMPPSALAPEAPGTDPFDSAVEKAKRSLTPDMQQQFDKDLNEFKQMAMPFRQILAKTGNPKALDAYLKIQQMSVQLLEKKYGVEAGMLDRAANRENSMDRLLLSVQAAQQRLDQQLANRGAPTATSNVQSLTQELKDVRSQIAAAKKNDEEPSADLLDREIQLQTELDQSRGMKSKPVGSEKIAGEAAANTGATIGPKDPKTIMKMEARIRELNASGLTREQIKDKIREEFPSE